MALPTIIAVGNLTADPELRFTATGTALVKLRIACGERRKNATTGEWEDGDTTYLSVSAWRQLAENVAESFTKGSRVSVIGRLKSRTVENTDGSKATYFEVDADSIAADTANATVRISKTTRTSGTGWSAEATTTVPAGDDGVPF